MKIEEEKGNWKIATFLICATPLFNAHRWNPVSLVIPNILFVLGFCKPERRERPIYQYGWSHSVQPWTSKIRLTSGGIKHSYPSCSLPSKQHTRKHNWYSALVHEECLETFCIPQITCKHRTRNWTLKNTLRCHLLARYLYTSFNTLITVINYTPVQYYSWSDHNKKLLSLLILKHSNTCKEPPYIFVLITDIGGKRSAHTVAKHVLFCTTKQSIGKEGRIF